MPRRYISDFAKYLMEVAGTKTAEEAVVHLINQKLGDYEPSPPVNLEIIASICDIQKILSTEMVEDGRLVLPVAGQGWVIQINKSQSLHRQRFTIAHEITHKLLDANPKSHSCTTIGEYAQQFEEEWLSDYGAKQLLLLTPQHLLPIILSNGYKLGTIKLIGEEFQVSFEAAARAVVDASLKSIAIVFFTPRYKKSEKHYSFQEPLIPGYGNKPKMRIVRTYQTRGFPILPEGKSVSADSIINRVYESNEATEVRRTEIHSFNDRDYFRFEIEVVRRPFYVEGKLQNGVIALLLNPEQV